VEHPLASNSGSLAPLPLRGTADPIRPDQAAAGPSLSFQDEQTLSQLRRGNWAAMEGLVQRYQDRLYVTVLRMVNHPEDAADLVQETFVRAMQNVARFEGKSTLYTWLFRIAINLAISHRRASQYRAAISLDGEPEDARRAHPVVDVVEHDVVGVAVRDGEARVLHRAAVERLAGPLLGDVDLVGDRAREAVALEERHEVREQALQVLLAVAVRDDDREPRRVVGGIGGRKRGAGRDHRWRRCWS